MTVSYDTFIGAFLDKVTEYDFAKMENDTKGEITKGYLTRALTHFAPVCEFEFVPSTDDGADVFVVDDKAESSLDEIIEIVSEGMVVQWLKPYYYRQELLSNAMNTRDFTTYSPAELLRRVGDAYKQARKDYTQMVREYSYNHGDLTSLHL